MPPTPVEIRWPKAPDDKHRVSLEIVRHYLPGNDDISIDDNGTIYVLSSMTAAGRSIVATLVAVA